MEKFKVVVGATHVAVRSKRAASAGPKRLSAKRLNLGKPLRRPVPNIAVNCRLIGIASSKTILIELLA